jgi:hypothetical protein
MMWIPSYNLSMLVIVSQLMYDKNYMRNFNFNIFIEFLSLVVAVCYLRWLRNSFWIWFIPFLAFTLLIEIAATFIWGGSNGWLYNIQILVQFLFTSSFFFYLSRSSRSRKLMQVLSIFFYLFSMYIYLVSGSFFDFNLAVFTLDCFLTVLFAILYLIECINENDVLKIRSQVPALWATGGTVIFFSIASIVINMHDFIRNNNLAFLGIYLDNIVPQILSLIMYSCFAYSFFLCRKIQAK